MSSTLRILYHVQQVIASSHILVPFKQLTHTRLPMTRMSKAPTSKAPQIQLHKILYKQLRLPWCWILFPVHVKKGHNLCLVFLGKTACLQGERWGYLKSYKTVPWICNIATEMCYSSTYSWQLSRCFPCSEWNHLDREDNYNIHR
jgi:hypothetical protein